ncbi:MAG: DUF6572 domain-containing protein [Ferruginibacter sp.]
MSIDQIDKIDIISTTPEGKVMLTISDHHLWDDAENHMLLLQNKLNLYLQFVENGQIFEEYPGAKNKQIVISVRMKYMPNATSLLLLNQWKETILNAGFEFEWRVFHHADIN